MKEDAPAPDLIPSKRTLIEGAPPHWLREWLNKEDITFREKKRIEKEIQRRKDAKPPVRLAIVAGPEGVTPHQIRMTREHLERIEPTEVRSVGQVAKLERLFPDDLNLCLDYGKDAVNSPEFVRSAIRDSTVVLAYPKETFKPDKVQGVWDAIRFAKHRNIPVRIVMPDGTEGRKQ